MSQMRFSPDQEAIGMILDDEALVERATFAVMVEQFIAVPGEDDRAQAARYATAAIEAVRVHMWDDGK